MKPFFTADDFKSINNFSTRHQFAEICNRKLEREGVVVYSKTENDTDWGYFNHEWPETQYRALLINIEEIEKKCLHERSISKLVDDGTECRSVCVRCGVPMLATWNEVK